MKIPVIGGTGLTRPADRAPRRRTSRSQGGAAERFGVRPILLEPMPEACRAAARLFGLPLVLADGGRIPLQAESVDAAWCLGVLDTVRDKAAVLREIHRVLPPGAPLGLLVIVARVPEIGPTPEGNFFPTRREFAELRNGTGFDLVEQIDHPGRAPLSWTRRVERITAAVAARHRDDRAHALATRQSESFTRLFAAGLLSVQLVHATRRPAGRPLPERVRP